MNTLPLNFNKKNQIRERDRRNKKKSQDLKILRDFLYYKSRDI